MFSKREWHVTWLLFTKDKKAYPLVFLINTKTITKHFMPFFSFLETFSTFVCHVSRLTFSFFWLLQINYAYCTFRIGYVCWCVYSLFANVLNMSANQPNIYQLVDHINSVGLVSSFLVFCCRVWEDVRVIGAVPCTRQVIICFGSWSKGLVGCKGLTF